MFYPRIINSILGAGKYKWEVRGYNPPPAPPPHSFFTFWRLFPRHLNPSQLPRYQKVPLVLHTDTTFNGAEPFPL
jgi:hypothetical protein